MTSAHPPGSDEADNPCISCGACCATYRVSFYWTEGLALPPALTERLTPHLGCMAGTSSKAPHCRALQGQVGASSGCSVYAQRPSPCRELQMGDAQCQRARAHHGLAPLP